MYSEAGRKIFGRKKHFGDAKNYVCIGEMRMIFLNYSLLPTLKSGNQANKIFTTPEKCSRLYFLICRLLSLMRQEPLEGQVKDRIPNF